MSFLKTPEEIEKMREGGKILSLALKTAMDIVAPGILLSQIDLVAEETLLSLGARPSFKNYKSSVEDIPFPSTVCLSLNEEVVHGLGNRPIALKEGDIISLDVGCWYEGLCTDMSVTIPVGNISPQTQQLLTVTKNSLFAGVQAALVGNHIRDISAAIEQTIKPFGFGIVRALVGHGVGHAVHEEPQIPNFTFSSFLGQELKNGMCLALEPMVTLGQEHVETGDDGWSIITKDRSLSAHFEVTIALTDQGTEILTPLPF